MRLTLAHPDALPAADFRGCWACIDDDAADFERTEAALPEALPLMGPREFQERVVRDRDDFLHWADAALAGQTGAEAAASPVSRNPFDEFPLHAFWLRIIAEATDCHGAGDLLVVTRSAGARDTLAAHARRRGIPMSCRGWLAYAFAGLRTRTRAKAKLAYQLATALCRRFLADAFLGDGYRARLRGIEVLVDTYLLSGDVAEDGAVRHRYYPGLLDWYRRRGMRAAYLPTLFRIRWRELPGLYRGYRKSEIEFVPPELFLDAADIVAVVRGCLRRARSATPLLAPYGGIDLTPLARHRRFRLALDRFEADLLGRVPARLATWGIGPRLVLDWFENQGYDQALLAGFVEARYDGRVVAMRQYAFMGNNLNLYVTTREVTDRRVPGEHWVCGDRWCDEASRFDRAGIYRTVPALRYAWLHDVKLPEHEGRDLLVVLTHSVTESAWLLRCLDDALNRLVQIFVRIRIKPHPAASAGRILRRLPGRVRRRLGTAPVVWAEAPLLEQMATIRMVVGAGTSAALEAACLGFPVVLIGRRTGLEMRPLQLVDARLWTTAYNGDELARALVDWSPEHPLSLAERRQLAQDARSALFEPVTEQGMEKFAIE